MTRNYHVGQRLSFESALCTVRYIGPVAGTEKDWLGVEWDDPSRGKHNGEHKGKSTSPTAASFVRPTRLADLEQSFVEAVYQKYTVQITALSAPVYVEKEIEISGKVVEEVGFEKISQQLAQLNELKIVLVDGLRINAAEEPGKTIREICPKIVELDLSRNLFESCKEIIRICAALDNLRSLRINANRLQILKDEFLESSNAFQGIREVEMDEMLLPWENICILAEQFVNLTKLTASSNSFTTLKLPINCSSLTSLALEYNMFSCLSDLSPLCLVASLETLYLKGNQISRTKSENFNGALTFGTKLHYVDLSYNTVASWNFVDEMRDIFPSLTAFRFSHNPIYASLSKDIGSAMSVEEGYMLTLARLPDLKALNFSNISTQERTNAEMFYLSRIAKAMAEVPESQEHTVTSQHMRYKELCEIYGPPTVIRKGVETINPDFLEARLIKFTFYLPAQTQKEKHEATTKEIEIPKAFDIYRVKGIVGRAFNQPPLNIRLIWETGEWDPVAGYEEYELDSDSDYDDDDYDDNGVDDKKELLEDISDGIESHNKGQWIQREVEIEDSTRQIGFCVDGTKAKVRVELR
ncbi:hypothetical protein B7463_g397, partial [Scytalidium lignicola]